MVVSTLSGKANNLEYTNGSGNNSTYLMPLGVAVDNNGVTYAFDDYVPVIRKIMPDGTTSQFVGEAVFVSPSWQIGFVDGANAKFSNITAIATDNQNNVYVMDNNRLRKVTPNGITSTITTDQTLFKSAEGICVDALGNIFVSDTGNKRIKKVTPSGVVTTIALGFNNPKGITLKNDVLFVADGATIKQVTQNGTVTTFANGFSSASGIGLLGTDFLVSDSFENKIKKVTSLGVVSDYAGSGQGGFRDTSNVFFWRLPMFNNPQGICILNGVCYVADTYNQRIRKITA